MNVVKSWLRDRGVILETTFMDAWRFVRDPTNLQSIDYVVIDVDLKPYAEYELEDPETRHQIDQFLQDKDYLDPHPGDADDADADARWNKARDELKKVAGYHIYTSLLMDFGFPTTHILFCSNHADHLTSIHEAFKQAKLNRPDIYRKNELVVKDWINDKRDNPYGILRRGVLAACRAIKKMLKRDQSKCICFNRFHDEVKETASAEYLMNYLSNLERLMPLREPEAQEAKFDHFRVFVQTLSREWDSADASVIRGKPRDERDVTLETLGTIMKTVRNWSAHGSVMSQLTDADVAFIFMANLRTMFVLPEEPQIYEKHLFRLFGESRAPDEREILDIIGYEKRNRNIPLAEAYRAAWSMNSIENTLSRFDIIVANAHRASEKGRIRRIDDKRLIRLLYQIFWFYPSALRIRPTDPYKGIAQFHCTFDHYDFGRGQPQSFLFQFARHIYGKSFPGLEAP